MPSNVASKTMSSKNVVEQIEIEKQHDFYFDIQNNQKRLQYTDILCQN